MLQVWFQSVLSLERFGIQFAFYFSKSVDLQVSVKKDVVSKKVVIYSVFTYM